MNDSLQHPNAERLRAFSEGRVDGSELTAIERHLQDCPACCDRLGEAPDDDSLLSRLRSAASPLPDGTPQSDHTLRSEAPAPPTPAGYEVLEELGRGGMGIVYKARQVSLNRLVALKVLLNGAHASPEEQVRFRAEAAALARIRHPNIVQVHDTGTHDGIPYFALEYVEGGSLATHLRGQPLTPATAAALIEVLARAVQAAHEQGVIHRDLKPANILLAPASGRDDEQARPEAGADIPKIADFGLAKWLGSEAGLTRTGTVAGTPSYMAPEQALGRRAEIGPAADVYGLGATLYELLTGRPPFQGPTALETIHQVLADDPVPPRRLQPKVPADLETICLKCLQKPPPHRYGSMGELAEDLRRFQAGEPIRARAVGPAEQAWRWCRRNPAVALLLAAVAVALLAGTAVSASFAVLAGQKAEEARGRAADLAISYKNERQARADAESETKRAERELERSRANLLTAQLRHVAGIYEREPLRALALLRDPEPCPPELRDAAWGFFESACKRWEEPATLKGHAKPIYAVAFSPDGQTLASGSEDRTIRLWDLATGQEKATLKGHTAIVTSLAFSPDGQTLASSAGVLYDVHFYGDRRRHGEVKLWDLAASKERAALKGHTDAVTSVAFSRDGNTLASGSWDHKVKLWEVPSGRELVTLEGPTMEVNCVAFSPDGQTLACGSHDCKVRVWEVATRNEQAVLEGHRWAVRSLAYSPDGKTLASAHTDNTVKVWDVGTGLLRASLPGHTSDIRSLAFSPDGKTVASASWDDTVRLWDVVICREQVVLPVFIAGFHAVAFSPDGQTLAAGGMDKAMRLWKLRPGQECASLKGHTAAIQSVAFRPDGKVLASGSLDQTIKLWDRQTGQEGITLRGHRDGVSAVAFSPDGLTLASGSADGTAKLWDIQTGKERVAFKLRTRGRVHDIDCMAFSPDSTTLALGGGDIDGNSTSNGVLKLCDVRTGQEWADLEGHTAGVAAVAFSPDGNTLASAGHDRVIRLWDARTGKEQRGHRGHGDSVISVAFAPDGSTLASGSWDKTVRLWDVKTGTPRATLKGHADHITAVTLSPDGQTLASADAHGEMKLWHAATGQERAAIKGHTEAVHSLAFSPDGNTLASASQDKTVKLWDVRTGANAH